MKKAMPDGEFIDRSGLLVNRLTVSVEHPHQWCARIICRRLVDTIE